MATREFTTSSTVHSESGTTELLRDLFRQMAAYISDVSALFRAELSEKAEYFKVVAISFAVAALFGLFAVQLLTIALVAGIAYFLGWGWAFLVVGVGYALVAGLVAMPAMRHLKSGSMSFEKTTNRVRQDSEWIKHKIAA